jgi:ligand-binding sensor domain-containing protein/signal transduction histidine kinase
VVTVLVVQPAIYITFIILGMNTRILILCLYFVALSTLNLLAQAVNIPPSVPKGANVLGLDPDKAITQYVIDVWRQREGLSQNAVQTILQTHDGYLWLGTQEGLVRFDGIKFTVFDMQHTQGIGGNNVYALCEDNKENLWIGTFAGGVSVYSNGKFKNYGKDKGIEGDVGDIIQDSKGTIWVGTNNGLSRYNARLDKFEKIIGNGAPVDILITRLKESENGILLISTVQGFYTMSGGTFRRYLESNGLAHERVNDVFVSTKTGDIWIATDGGVQKFENGQFTTLMNKRNTGMPSSVSLFVYEDSRANFFVGTNEGLCRIRSGSVEVLSGKNGLGSNEVLYIFEDREGSLWIGTNVGGLNRLRNGKFTPFGVPEGLSHPMLWGIFQDSRGSIWVPTNGGGINEIRDGRVVKVYGINEGLPTTYVRSVGESNRGVLYFGTQEKGVAKLSKGKFDVLTKNDGLAGNFVRVTYQHPDGSLWFGTHRSGFTIFRDGIYSTYTVNEGLLDNTIYGFLLRKDGKVWIATRGGLVVFSNGKFSAYTTDHGLSHNVIMNLYEDSEGVLWLVTNGGGINRYKDGKFTSAMYKDGMPDDTEYAILEDNKNYFWMPCNRGVIRVSKAELNNFLDGNQKKINSAELFTVADGMRSSECNGGNQFPAVKAKDGKFWFATVAGAAIIDPENIQRNVIAPPVVIENIAINNESISDFSNNSNILPTKTNFEFYYTGLSLFYPAKVQFKYLLEGYDKNWVEAGTRRTAYYTNLPRGRDYRFRVIACNNDGVWNEVGASVTFSIQSFWWEAWWFYGLCIIIVSGGSYEGFRWRTRRLRSKAEALERVVENRTKEVQSQAQEIQLKNTALQEQLETLRRTQTQLAQAEKMASLGTLVAGVAHELNTPIGVAVTAASTLHGKVQAFENEYKAGGLKKSTLESFMENAKIGADLTLRNLERASNLIQSFKQVAVDQTSDSKRVINLKHYIEGVITSLEPKWKTTGHRVEIECVATLELETYPGAIAQIITNLVTNSLMHGFEDYRDDGVMTIVVERDKENIVLRYSDNGRGIPREILARIFDPFFTTKQAQGGTGLGMHIVYNLVTQKLAGEIQFVSADEGGVAFLLTFPLMSREYGDNGFEPRP